MATGQNREVDSGSALRSMRRSSSVGLGGFINSGRPQETAFPPQGQLWSAGLGQALIGQGDVDFDKEAGTNEAASASKEPA
jgi:hypothetical protein